MASIKDKAAQAGIDYNQAMDRFGGNDALYAQLAVKFLDEPHFSALDQALSAHDLDAAQREAHSLKGVAGNLSFTELYQLSCTIYDALREADLQAARALMPQAREAYERVQEALRAVRG